MTTNYPRLFPGQVPEAGTWYEICDALGIRSGNIVQGITGGTTVPIVTGNNINTVLQAAGGAGWEKAQAATANYVIVRPASGASLDLHVETGTLAALTVANWPIPASGVDQLRIRNMSAIAQTFTATGFSGIVTADGNAATSGSYSIPVDMAVHITIDGDGWVQIAPMGQEVSQAELDAALALKVSATSLADGTIHAFFESVRADGVTFLPTATDPKDIVGAGWFNIQNPVGLPAGWYYIFNAVHRNTTAVDPTYTFQLAKRLDSSVTNNLLMRIETASTYSAWVTIATATGTMKFGTGQGIDAQTDAAADVVNFIANIASTATSTIANTDIVARFGRPGTAGTKHGNVLDIVIGSHTAGIGANTQVDFRLNNGNVLSPDMTILSLRSNGDIYAFGNKISTKAPIPAYSASQTSYAVGDQVIEALKLYKCKTAITAAEAFTISKWDEVSAQVTDKAPVKAYSASATYAVGDQVIESLKLYQCKTAITVAEAFTVAKWDEVSAGAVADKSPLKAYSASSTYAVDDQVIQSDIIYQCITAITVAEAFAVAKWKVISSTPALKTINGESIVGSGNLAVTSAASLPGSTTQTATNEGLDSGNATVDTTTVPGQTILKYTTAGATTFTPPTGVTSAEVLVVAGGGGGGSGVGGDLRGGGGGAGGLISDAAVAVTPGSSIALTVGAGGAAAVTGSDSVFDTLTADGGGRGGSGAQTGFAGGSGGGGGANSGGANSFAGGTGVSGEGSNGGTGGSDGTSYRNGGGGGGASAVGAAGSANGTGGAGTASIITGASVTYAGGGGGGGPVAANGGAGGGGRGGAYSAGAATAGSPNTGGGGGGGANTVAGAAGGSGVVIVRFATQTRSYQALTSYVDNAAAVTAGLLAGEFYRKISDGSVQQVA